MIYSHEAEASLLSAMIGCNRLIDDIEGITEDHFGDYRHKLIYRGLLTLSVQSIPVDAVTLSEALQRLQVLEDVGLEYLVDLASWSTGESNAKHYAQIVKDKFIARMLLVKSSEIQEIAKSGIPSADMVNQCQRLIMDITTKDEDAPKHINPVLKQSVEQIDYRFNHKGKLHGLPTGFCDIDKLTGGLMPGNSVVIAGRPSMGKTALAVNICENIAIAGKTALFFSLEMSAEELVFRMIAGGGINNERLKSGDLMEEDWPRLTATVTKLKDKGLYIDDSSGLTTDAIRSRARKLTQQTGKPLGVICIDYLQLLADTSNENSTQRIGAMSAAIKRIARELQCPVITLSQLNRGLEQRQNKRPIMSDLRESGAIEQDADIIGMVYRDEIYDEYSREKGIAEVIFRKNRNGALGTVYLKSELHFFRFRDNQGYIPQNETYHNSGLE